MASTLLENTDSAAQYEENLLTNTPDRIKVVVEDELDVVVWSRILSRYAPGYRFEVSPYSYGRETNGKGKAQILAMADRFGRYYIGCVDSDYDWLLEEWTVDGQLIQHCPHILQTFAYSVENLAAQPGGKEDCMMECTLHCSPLLADLDKDYGEFIKAVSEAVYEVLLWHLVMRKEGVDEDRITPGWNEIFNNAHYANIRGDENLTLQDKRSLMIGVMRQKADNLVSRYEFRYPRLIPSREALETFLADNYGLSRDNAYLYVRGHNLHDFLIHNFFIPVRDMLVSEHISEIKSHTTGQETGNAIGHYKRLLKNFERDYIHRIDFLQDNHNSLASRLKHSILAITA